MCSKKNKKGLHNLKNWKKKPHQPIMDKRSTCGSKSLPVTRHSKLDAIYEVWLSLLLDLLPCPLLFSLHQCHWPFCHIQTAHQISQAFDTIQFHHFCGCDSPFSVTELNQQRLWNPQGAFLVWLCSPYKLCKTCHFSSHRRIQLMTAPYL